ncbi:MAG TPA: cytochrome c biogenesis protein CcsA [Polyangia bacterium]|jgi:heme exporter protein C|nr:cytochrome c biogenesis protein CcsA [Polyangia bacterium]
MKRGGLFLALVAVTALGLAVVPSLIINAPTEPTMGFIQRIFYYHVATAWLTFLSAFVCAGASIGYLANVGSKSAQRWDGLAMAAAELTVVFGTCMLVTGPLWGRKAWGVWWVWKDVRLMTALLLWFIFVAYLLVRRFGGPGSARLGAGLGIFAAADVPLIYTSVFFWRTQHPKATVVTSLDPGILLPFLLALATFTVLYVVLLWLRMGLETARIRLEDLQLAAEDAGLLDEMR